MGLNVNWESKIIEVTSPTTDVDAQTLHDFIEDNMATSIGMGYDDIMQPEGKVEDPSNPGVFSQIIMILNSPWQIQFWGGSGYTRIYGGKIVGGLADEPIKATGTAGDVTVLESPVDGLTVATGAPAESSEDIADAVWDEILDEHITSGTFGGELATKADIASASSTDQSFALSGSVIYGTETSGTYASTAVRDGTYWQITEDATNGITVEMTFNLPSTNHRPGAFEVFGRYSGIPSTTHHIELQAYNYESVAWEDLKEIFMPGGITSDDTFSHEYYERHIDRSNNNEVKIRLVHHVTTYNATHNLYLDYAEISSINVITAGDIADAVWDEASGEHITVATFGKLLADLLEDTSTTIPGLISTMQTNVTELLGLTGENVKWSSITHDANNLMTAARITLYTDNTLVTPVKSWDVTATYNVSGEIASYQMVEV